MKQLTKDQQLACETIRKSMFDRLKSFSLTDQMLRDKSLFQLLNLLELLVGNFNYIGTFSHTCAALEEIFGDALWDKPLVPNTEAEPEKPKLIVN